MGAEDLVPGPGTPGACCRARPPRCLCRGAGQPHGALEEARTGPPVAEEPGLWGGPGMGPSTIVPARAALGQGQVMALRNR